MNEIITSAESPTILTFEDNILECFFMDGSTRLHTIHIKGIELSTNNNGKHLLTIQLKHKSLFINADEKPLEEVKALVGQIKQSMTK